MGMTQLNVDGIQLAAYLSPNDAVPVVDVESLVPVHVVLDGAALNDQVELGGRGSTMQIASGTHTIELVTGSTGAQLTVTRRYPAAPDPRIVLGEDLLTNPEPGDDLFD